MAGFLDALTSVFRRSPQATVVGDGVTYGPAVSRLTRTPIEFGPGAGVAGRFRQNGTMLVDPSAASNVGEVVNHESVHALLSDPRLLNAATAGPQVQALRATLPRFVGDAQQELPAYLATGEINRVPGAAMTPSARSGALAEVIANLARQDPNAARTFGRLARP